MAPSSANWPALLLVGLIIGLMLLNVFPPRRLRRFLRLRS
jgi:hypothetical protein